MAGAVHGSTPLALALAVTTAISAALAFPAAPAVPAAAHAEPCTNPGGILAVALPQGPEVVCILVVCILFVGSRLGGLLDLLIVGRLGRFVDLLIRCP